MGLNADYLIVGGGIAGASVGYWLAQHGRVVLLERESQPGYHSTGRSAALFMESYGTPQVRALTMASRAFLETPPDGFTDHPVLSPRGAMMVATHGQDEALQAHWDVLRAISPRSKLLDAAGACEITPVLRREKLAGAVLEPDAMDMDVHAIHQGFLRGIRRNGGSILREACRYRSASPRSASQGTCWRRTVCSRPQPGQRCRKAPALFYPQETS